MRGILADIRQQRLTFSKSRTGKLTVKSVQDALLGVRYLLLMRKSLVVNILEFKVTKENVFTETTGTYCSMTQLLANTLTSCV
jgi:hypothetical protein